MRSEYNFIHVVTTFILAIIRISQNGREWYKFMKVNVEKGVRVHARGRNRISY